MNPWLILLLPSLLVGVLVAIFIRKPFAPVIAGGVPWLGLLSFVLYEEYFVPYQGGGASMWPIAVIFGGTAAAVGGLAGFALTKLLVTRKK